MLFFYIQKPFKKLNIFQGRIREVLKSTHITGKASKFNWFNRGANL